MLALWPSVAAAMLLPPAARQLSEPRASIRMGAAVGADTRFAVLTGRVLTPGSSGDGWWDGRCAAMPVVLPVDANALNHLSVARLKHWVLR